MRKSSENIAQVLQNIIHESIQKSHPEQTFPPYLEKMTFREPYGLLTIGKAALSMAEVFLNHISSPPLITCIITSDTYLPKTFHKQLPLYLSEHPFPGEKTVQVSRSVLETLQHTIPLSGEVVLLLSGGGSSLFEIPLPPITIQDISKITKMLMEKGANIKELNTVRKHLSAVKGGKLAQILYPRKIHAFIMSDVLGDNLEFIASGPVTPDTTTPHDAKRILTRYGLDATVIPEQCQKRAWIDFSHVTTTIISNNRTLIEQGKKVIVEKGFPVKELPFQLSGEASLCGKKIARWLVRHSGVFPMVYIGGGETSVTVKGHGKGGRNMELILQVALELCDTDLVWGIAAVGSDGIDGPTDAAGAWISHEKITPTIKTMGIQALKDNDSYTFFKAINGLIYTGYTGINLNDMFIAFIDKKRKK